MRARAPPELHGHHRVSDPLRYSHPLPVAVQEGLGHVVGPRLLLGCLVRSGIARMTGQRNATGYRLVYRQVARHPLTLTLR